VDESISAYEFMLDKNAVFVPVGNFCRYFEASKESDKLSEANIAGSK
jgi:hypothetical protein